MHQTRPHGVQTYSADPHAEVHERVHCVLLGQREPRVLVQPSPILVRHTVAVLDVQRNDADLVRVTAVRTSRERIAGRGHHEQRANGRAAVVVSTSAHLPIASADTADDAHHIATVQQWDHFLYQGLRYLAFCSNACGAILWVWRRV